MASMNPTISREFWRDLAELPSAVSGRAVRTIERMLDNPWASELHPETVRRAEKGVHSCRVDESYRIIWKFIKPNEMVLCLVDTHDEAYRRAVRKSFTLADGVVRVADVLQTAVKPPEDSKSLLGWPGGRKAGAGALFMGYRDNELLNLGVPADVLPQIRQLSDVNELELVERLLPVPVFDKLLSLALGVSERTIVPDEQLRTSLQRYEGGDELRRFVDSEEFQRALSGSMEDWMLFLTPLQSELVTRNYAGPARVKGVVGSGKTVVAIHRTRHLAKFACKKGGRVLFLTFGNRLPRVTYRLLEHLAGEGAPELAAVECATIHSWCWSFLRAQGLRPRVRNADLRDAIGRAIAEARQRYPSLSIWSRPAFLREEIQYAIKGRGVATLDDYLKLERTGRGTPLRPGVRRAVFDVYQAYQHCLKEKRLWDYDDFILEALRRVGPDTLPVPYIAAVVDEIQDLTETVMRLIRKIVAPGLNDLFLVGDGLQRIYPGGYSLRRLGIDITGRGSLLVRNYRNTQEILCAAHAMVSMMRVDDMDEEDTTVQEPEYSVRQGEVPRVCGFRTRRDEIAWVSTEIQRLKARHGYEDGDFVLLYRWSYPYQGLIVRGLSSQFSLTALSREADSYLGPGMKHTTYDSAKGLEFKVVFVLGVTDGISVPRDDPTLEAEEAEDYLARERRRLYVAMTRARDLPYITYSEGQPSRFLKDIPRRLLNWQSG
jgi:superfamily I DNA/RNA helicase/mRNA-degrading endonuclease RelE of RelBE toxin-antitoxin system